MSELDGRVVAVTGAGGGIGFAAVRAFASAGAHVVAIDRDGDAVRRTCDNVAGPGLSCEPVELDITDPDQIDAVVTEILGRHSRIDALHNNAGAFRPEGLLEDLDPRAWDITFRVNTLGSANMCRAILPHMVAAGSGAIVNTSSAHARLGDKGWASYGVAKAGVEALTRSVATQYGIHGVRCNAIAPGLVETEGALSRLPASMATGLRSRSALGRLGRPGEIADVAVFLASDRASLITGQVIRVDGGLTVSMPHLTFDGDLNDGIQQQTHLRQGSA